MSNHQKMESISSDSYSRTSKHKKSKSSHKSPSKSSPGHHEKYLQHRSRNRSRSRSSYSGSSHGRSDREDEESDSEIVSRRRDAVRSSRREAVRSRSVTSCSDTEEENRSDSDNSYYSRSVSRSPTSNKQSSHRKNRASSPHTSSKRSRSHERHHSRSPPRESKRRRHARDPRDKSSREFWDNEVLQIGCWMKDTIFHFCDTCDRPIFVYGRLIPCKHVYCLTCAGTHKDKICTRCNEKVIRVERAELGSIHMCFQGGTTHSKNGCRRTYLSQRDLEAHMSHRHKTALPRSLTSGNAISPMQMGDQSGHTVMTSSAQQQNQMTTATPSSGATGPPPGINAFPLHRPPPYTVPPNTFSRPPPPTNNQPPNFSRPPPPNQYQDHPPARASLAPGAQYGVPTVQHHLQHQGQPWPQPRPQF